MPAATNLRTGRQVALLAAIQAALGTPQTAFVSSPVFWTHSTEIPVSPKKTDDTWMAETAGPAPEERMNIGDRPLGRIVCPVTPDAIDLLLRSNWGPKVGSLYTLASQVNEWLTLAWMEWAAAGNVGQIVRIQDAWFHRLYFHAVFPRGFLIVGGSFIGRRILPDAKGSGGLTFPASLMPERNPVTVNAAAFVRDPAGLNVSIRIRELEITLNQRPAAHEWDYADLLYSVGKAGPTNVQVHVRAEVSDEAWALITDARAGTMRQFRFTATAQSPVKTLTITLNNLDFEFEELGHDGKDMREIVADGRAHLDAGELAVISIT
jgi:hypothetical protein